MWPTKHRGSGTVLYPLSNMTVGGLSSVSDGSANMMLLVWSFSRAGPEKRWWVLQVSWSPVWAAWSGSWQPLRRQQSESQRCPRPARMTSPGRHPGPPGRRGSPDSSLPARSDGGVSWLPGNTTHPGHRKELDEQMEEISKEKCTVWVWYTKMWWER